MSDFTWLYGSKPPLHRCGKCGVGLSVANDCRGCDEFEWRRAATDQAAALRQSLAAILRDQLS